MNTPPPRPRPKSWLCEDWKTVLTPDRKSTKPCPQCQKKPEQKRTAR